MKTAIRPKLTLALIALIFTVFTGVGLAQTNFSGNIHFNSGFPSGELHDQINDNAYGIGGQIFYSPANSPWAIGLELSWMQYGSDTRQEAFSSTIPDVTVDVTNSNNIAQGFLVLRGRIPQGSVQLYGDALVGLNYMYTETRISDTGFDVFDVASHTNQDDVAFAYGFGGGVMVPVYTKKIDINKKGGLEVMLDTGLRYVIGGEAEYLKEGSINIDDGIVSFETISSKTDMLKLHIGVALRF